MHKQIRAAIAQAYINNLPADKQDGLEFERTAGKRLAHLYRSTGPDTEVTDQYQAANQ